MRRCLFSTLSALVICGGAIFSGSSALAQTPQPGLWRTTVKMQMSGVPGMPAGAMPQATTNTQCITPEMAKDPAKAFATPAAQGAQGCKHGGKWSGAALNYER